MQIKLLVDGGAMKPGPALSQKLGPLGVNVGKVISEVNNCTKQFSGMKVPVLVDIDVKTKNVKAQALTPPVSALLKREAGIEKGSQMPNKIKVANIPIETAIKVANTKESGMLTNSFKAAVKTVVGNCVSIGLLIESKEPNEIIEEINQGKYDKEINSKQEEASPEKLAQLASDFENVKKLQEVVLKEIEAKKEAKEAAAAGAAAPGAEGAPATGGATGTTPAPTAAPVKEEKKKGK
jgi:large subunit ribosomal protein L11